MTQAQPGWAKNGSATLRTERSTRFVGNHAHELSPPPSRPTAARRPPVTRPPRRALMQVRHIDPAYALRQAAVWAGVGFAVSMVAVTLLYAALAALGVIGTVNALVGQAASAPGHSSGVLLSLSGVWQLTAFIGGFVALMAIVLAGLTVTTYNLCARLVGGLDITLSER